MKINENELILIRGDTFETNPIEIYTDPDEQQQYELNPSDQLRWVCKKNLSDGSPLITKIIPNDTKILRLESQETKKFENPKQPQQVLKYYYDLELTKRDGTVITLIRTMPIYVRSEVD